VDHLSTYRISLLECEASPLGCDPRLNPAAMELMTDLAAFKADFKVFIGMIANYNWVCISNYFMFLVWFLKLFSQQYWSAVVTQTLINSAGKVMRFGVIFCFLNVTFCAVGVAVFGVDQVNFIDFSTAFQTTFRYALVGPEWDDVNTGRNFYVSLVWFYTFSTLQMLIMFNMIIGILFDTYASVQEEMTQTVKPLGEQGRFLVRNSRMMRFVHKTFINKSVARAPILEFFLEILTNPLDAFLLTNLETGHLSQKVVICAQDLIDAYANTDTPIAQGWAVRIIKYVNDENEGAVEAWQAELEELNAEVSGDAESSPPEGEGKADDSVTKIAGGGPPSPGGGVSRRVANVEATVGDLSKKMDLILQKLTALADATADNGVNRAI